MKKRLASLVFRTGTVAEIEDLLEREHYLGPLRSGRIVVVGEVEGEIVAAQVLKKPTARKLPSDGTWLELSRWCLTPEAGEFAGSRMMLWLRSYLFRSYPEVTTLVSYSDPKQGHTGALYLATGWQWRPTWHVLLPPPSGNGSWNAREQGVKDRWAYFLAEDESQALLWVGEGAEVRRARTRLRRERAMLDAKLSAISDPDGAKEKARRVHSAAGGG